MDVAGVMVAGGRKLEQARGAGATNTPERRFNVMHPLVEVIAREINRSLNQDPVRNFVALPNPHFCTPSISSGRLLARLSVLIIPSRLLQCREVDAVVEEAVAGVDLVVDGAVSGRAAFLRWV